MLTMSYCVYNKIRRVTVGATQRRIFSQRTNTNKKHGLLIPTSTKSSWLMKLGHSTDTHKQNGWDKIIRKFVSTNWLGTLAHACGGAHWIVCAIARVVALSFLELLRARVECFTPVGAITRTGRAWNKLHQFFRTDWLFQHLSHMRKNESQKTVLCHQRKQETNLPNSNRSLNWTIDRKPHTHNGANVSNWIEWKENGGRMQNSWNRKPRRNGWLFADVCAILGRVHIQGFWLQMFSCVTGLLGVDSGFDSGFGVDSSNKNFRAQLFTCSKQLLCES